jgi:hypothetical protein
LTLVATSAAFAGTGVGKVFKLGKTNAVNAVSSLVGSVASGSMLKIDNNGGGAALSLESNDGAAPLVVNPTAGKAINLNADKIDGQEASTFIDSVADVKVRYGSSVLVPAVGPVVRDSFAYCQPGEVALSGGSSVTEDPSDPGTGGDSGVYKTFMIESGPVTQTGNRIPQNGAKPIGWHAGVNNNSGQQPGIDRNVYLNSYVVCGS